MTNPAILARRIFLVAGVYGLVVTVSLYFSENPSGIVEAIITPTT
jgi:hypothetical protein